MTSPYVDIDIIPTTHGTGPYHPAIRHPDGWRPIWIWADQSFETETKAYNAACGYINSLQPQVEIINSIVYSWALRMVHPNGKD